MREERAGEDARGDEAAPPRTRRMLAEADEDQNGNIAYAEFVPLAVEVVQTLRLKAKVKELAIEDKLSLISDEWADEQLAFVQFKNRGPIALKGAETAELMEKLEATQMNLGAVTASRYITPFKEEVQEWIVKLSTVSELPPEKT